MVSATINKKRATLTTLSVVTNKINHIICVLGVSLEFLIFCCSKVFILSGCAAVYLQTRVVPRQPLPFEYANSVVYASTHIQ